MKLIQKLKQAYYADSLTGMNNMRAYQKALRQYDKRYHDTEITVISIHIDNLDALQYDYGRKARDATMLFMADILQDILKEQIRNCYLLDDDEYICILSGDMRSYVPYIEDITGFTDKPYPVELSIGYAVNTEGVPTMNRLVRQSYIRMAMRHRQNR